MSSVRRTVFEVMSRLSTRTAVRAYDVSLTCEIYECLHVGCARNFVSLNFRKSLNEHTFREKEESRKCTTVAFHALEKQA